MSDVAEFEVYSRVCDSDGFKGTVLYIGPVAAAKNKEEIWLGVKWDKPDRGKHDGSCIDDNGVNHRYFECPPGSGSFVKPSKVSRGKSLIEALKERYVELDAPEITNSDSMLPDAFVLTSKGNQKSIEFRGEKKIRKWQQIDVVEKVGIRSENISSIGDNISELAGHFKEIDLQDNLIFKWSEIGYLTDQLQNLSSLLLHGNKLQPLTEEIKIALPKNCFTKLKVLALNSCNISSWDIVERLKPMMPNIEELYLADNQLLDIPYSTFGNLADAEEVVVQELTGFEKLRVLDVCGCGLDSWSQVLYFKRLPALQEISLDGNNIQTILPSPGNAFLSLQRISLSGNKLENWSDIDALSTYSSIRQIRLSQIPLFSGKGASEVRPKVIARIKHLTFFNGSGISQKERIDSEKSYLRSMLREVEDLKNMPPPTKSIELLHPRFTELNDLYGQDLLPMGRVNESLSLAADMITVTFKNMSFSSGGTLEPITKKIPSSVTIARLRMMVKQMIGLDIKAQQLSLRIYKDSPPTLLDDDQSTIQYFGAIDGAEIFINEAKI